MGTSRRERRPRASRHRKADGHGAVSALTSLVVGAATLPFACCSGDKGAEPSGSGFVVERVAGSWTRQQERAGKANETASTFYTRRCATRWPGGLAGDCGQALA